jgi:hypothetical protein
LKGIAGANDKKLASYFRQTITESVHWHGQDTVARLVQDLFAASTTEAAPVLLRLKSGQGSRSRPFDDWVPLSRGEHQSKNARFFWLSLINLHHASSWLQHRSATGPIESQFWRQILFYCYFVVPY